MAVYYNLHTSPSTSTASTGTSAIRQLIVDGQMLITLARAYKSGLSYDEFVDQNPNIQQYICDLTAEIAKRNKLVEDIEKKKKIQQLKEKKEAEQKAAILSRFTEEECAMIGYRKNGYGVKCNKS